LIDQTYILAARRSPGGAFLGSLSGARAVDLGAMVVKELLAGTKIQSEQVDEVIMGNVVSSGLGQAPARQVALKSGIPPQVAALTINKVCGSGLKAVMLAAAAVQLGDADLVVAGGMESMSQAPHLLQGARRGWKFGAQAVVDALQFDGLTCGVTAESMISQAEYTANKFSIDRLAQDEYALESHRRAVAAQSEGLFDRELVEVEVRGKAVTKDQCPRPDTSIDKLAGLRPVIAEGTVTAGNASAMADGAAAVLVGSGQWVEKQNLQPLARVVAYATAGVEPMDVFIAPVMAIRKVLDKAGLGVDDIDLFELNEAFAVQMLACIQELQLPTDRLNVHGGGIALGHPLGASGARVLVTLLHAMQQRKVRRGLVSLCLGGGNAVAMIVERCD
jgi:acetyl-CoA C-acetyltransferase